MDNDNLKKQCPFCGTKILDLTNFCPACGKKIRNICKSCNKEIELKKDYCDECQELMENDRYRKNAILCLIIFAVLFIVFYFIFDGLSALGNGLSQGSTIKLSPFVSFVKIISPCFMFSSIPFIMSMIYSKKSKLYGLFIIEVIILIIDIILSFI